MRWDPPVTSRDQQVLFSERLDEVLPADHAARRLDEVLHQVDFTEWELRYSQSGPGRPPIHPRVMAGVIIYGLMVRIRSSRQLEYALQYRLDFRWLAEERSIDHTTICIFRRANLAPLKDLFVQLGLIAQRAGFLTLEQLAFDGTKIRANNRRHGSRSVKKLREAKRVLQQKFDEFARTADTLDEEEQLSSEAIELEDAEVRLKKIAKAIDEIERLEEAGEPVPSRIPLTDPESRITPNKEGGFSPNYTPLALVDVDSGMVASPDVIADGEERTELSKALDEAQENFDTKPKAVLADGHFSHGSNLVDMEERGIDFYSPVQTAKENPALREDPTTPVPEDQWDKLPTKKIQEQDQLEKQSFVYDEQRDCYYCPQGKELRFRSVSPEKRTDGTIAERRRYQADPKDCESCPLKELCLRGKKARFRRISRDQFDPFRERLARRMASEQGRKIYSQRAPVGERPFAVIKNVFGVRQFLTRGLERVRSEWLWMVTAFNILKIFSQPSRAGPRPTTTSSLSST